MIFHLDTPNVSLLRILRMCLTQLQFFCVLLQFNGNKSFRNYSAFWEIEFLAIPRVEVTDYISNYCNYAIFAGFLNFQVGNFTRT